MDINTLDYLEQIHIIQAKGLSEYLQSCDDDEDLGVSVERYRKILLSQDSLSDDVDKTLRGIMLRHQGRLLMNTPVCSVVFHNNTNEIGQFCNDLQEILLDNSLIGLDAFVAKYSQLSNMYANYEIIKHLHLLKDYSKESVFLQNIIGSLFDYSEDDWNQKECCYGYAMLLFALTQLFVPEELEQDANCCSILKNMLNLTYLFLTRVVCWPEDSEIAKRDKYDLPIKFEHRIGALLKRVELLSKYSNHFDEMVPGLSNVGTLIVSDYYFAHELSFALETLGRSSEFKRDARDKYKSLKNNVRPYSTCISDGKKDSVELAHRFYLDFSRHKYALNLHQQGLFDRFVKSKLDALANDIKIKKDKDQIIKYFRQNGIEYLYHFTEKANLPSIRRSHGLLSQRDCLVQSIIPKTSGEMRHLRTKDSEFYLEDYVRLSLCHRHPLSFTRSSELVILKIKLDVALFESTLFSDRDAAQDNHQHGGSIADLEKIHIESVKKTIVDKNDPEYYFSQAEVMVKSFIPVEYIVNINNPESI